MTSCFFSFKRGRSVRSFCQCCQIFAHKFPKFDFQVNFSQQTFVWRNVDSCFQFIVWQRHNSSWGTQVINLQWLALYHYRDNIRPTTKTNNLCIKLLCIIMVEMFFLYKCFSIVTYKYNQSYSDRLHLQ